MRLYVTMHWSQSTVRVNPILIDAENLSQSNWSAIAGILYLKDALLQMTKSLEHPNSFIELQILIPNIISLRQIEKVVVFSKYLTLKSYHLCSRPWICM